MISWIILKLFAFILVAAAKEQRNFRFVINDFYLKPFETDLFENIKWKLENNRSVTSWITLSRDIDHFDMDTYMDMIRPNNQTMRIYQMRLDPCKFLTMMHKNRILNLWAKSLNRSSKNFMRCPLKAHFNYFISKMHLEETDFPKYVPEYHYKGLTKFYVQNKMVLRLFIAGKVEHVNRT